jgi:hypothetical protein
MRSSVSPQRKFLSTTAQSALDQQYVRSWTTPEAQYTVAFLVQCLGAGSVSMLR